jgi:hypothetical protein
MPTAGILIIGNEILSGKVVDTNSPYLCRELRGLGVDVERIVTIPDLVEVIAAEVKQMSRAPSAARSNAASRLRNGFAARGPASPTRACSRWRWFPPARCCWTRATSGSRW